MKLPALTTNQWLAAAGMLLGFLALFGGTPTDNFKHTIDSKELALIVENKSDHITVQALADKIITGKAGYILVDLNEPAEFEEYHIPGAVNIPLRKLTDGRLQRSDVIYLYSNGGIHAAQAWMLLRARGYSKCYTLLGGLEEWKGSVLFPTLAATATAEEKAAFEKRKETALYFGGTPQTGDSTGNVAKAPSLTLPTMPQGGQAAGSGGGKKKKEGC